MLKTILKFLTDSDQTESKIERTLTISQIEPLDKSIWEKLKNSIISKKGSKAIKLQEISETERKECRKIIDYIINYAATEFGRKLTLARIAKTKDGYRIDIRCSKSYICRQNWSSKVNLQNNEVIFKCNHLCEHFISAEQSNFIIIPLF